MDKNSIISFIKNRGGLVNYQDFKEQGFQPRDIRTLLEAGHIQKLKSGLYTVPGADLHPYAIVQKAIPKSVIALTSALAWHDLTTQNPSQIFVAIPQADKAPALSWPPVSVHFFSENMYQSGIETAEIDGHEIQIYGPEKSVCDLFRFRNKLGEDIALEALNRYLQSKKRDLQTLSRFMDICRVKTVMKPYVKVLVS